MNVRKNLEVVPLLTFQPRGNGVDRLQKGVQIGV